MLIAGSCSPCVVLSVSAIGVTDTAEKNKDHSAKIFQFLTGELGLGEDRLVRCLISYLCCPLHKRVWLLIKCTFYIESIVANNDVVSLSDVFLTWNYALNNAIKCQMNAECTAMCVLYIELL